MAYYVGIEGGSTGSTISVINGDGEIIACGNGDGTNHWLCGMDSAAKLLFDMIKNVASSNKIELPFESIGLSISGADDKAAQDLYKNTLEKLSSGDKISISNHISVCNDSYGAIYTTSVNGGMLLISGTGSNCCLVCPDGNSFNCGGWGHAIECKGSAYWIAHRALVAVFDHDDNFDTYKDENVDYLRSAMFEHFKVSSRFELLPHFYSNFDKSKIAKFCVKVAEGADKGDATCARIFFDAGQILAKHIVALSPKVTTPNLDIVVVGGVFESWHLLRDGFVEAMRTSPVVRYRLLRLRVSGSVGAAYWGARQAGVDITSNVDLTKNYKIMFDSEQY